MGSKPYFRGENPAVLHGHDGLLIPLMQLRTLLEQMVTAHMPLLRIAVATRTLKHAFEKRTGWPVIRGDMREATDEHKMSQ